ncbi:MAG: hypothetical protein ACREM1_03950 [Longimicrobiales bacterium]
MEALERLLEATPDYRMAHFYLGLTHAAAGDHAQALQALARADPDGTYPDAVAVRGVVLARSGQREAAEDALRTLHGIASGHYALPFHEALIRLALGDVERALTLLEEDADRRTWFSRILGVEPLVDPLRDHPRFRALLARVRTGASDE